MHLPADVLISMRDAARAAGEHALQVKWDGVKESTLKADESIVTKADKEGEAIIRERLAAYGFNILGEEDGLTDHQSDYTFVIDPIDGTTNYDRGDPGWMVCIGLMYKGEPVAGVTYQPDVDKMYFAEQGKGAYLEVRNKTIPLHIPPAPARSYVIDTLFSRHPNFERQGVLYARSYEDIPDVLEDIAGKKITPKYRTTGCPSVPLSGIAEGTRSALIAKPVKLWDVAASIIIAKEAGALVHYVPEDLSKDGLQDEHMILASVPEIFPALKHIFESTINKHAHVYNARSDDDIPQKMAQQNIRYGISVGRRQPMHGAHLDCIQEMQKAGLHPVIVIGSANEADNKYFDPLQNPFSIAQQREQIRLAMEKSGVRDYTILALRDRGSMQHWVSSLNWMLQQHNIKAEEAVMHFRTKAVDKDKLEGIIKPLSAYQETITDYGISVWESVNRDVAFDAVSASPYRLMDVEGEAFNRLSHQLVVPEYVKEQALQARKANPDKALLSDLPVTMVDLSLMRMANERGVSTATLLKGKKAAALEQVVEATQMALKQPYITIKDPAPSNSPDA